MKKINLKKYGFERWESEDFSDDGNSFKGYKIGDSIRVSKLVADGDLYLAGHVNGMLKFDEYSKLPHYKYMNKLNGVPVSCVTEEDLYEVANGLIEFEKEYREAEVQIVLPTKAEIIAKRHQILNVRKAELAEVEELATVKKLLKMDSYKLSNFKSYYNSLEDYAMPKESDEDFANRLYNSRYSRDYVEGDYDLKPNFYYKELLEYLSK